jgi:hypothetical protein
MADKYERFVASYLRLNGYFTVPSFIVHAADDPTRICVDRVGNYTETDIIAVRMPYSREVTGRLHVENHDLLIAGANEKIEVVIAEVKSGNDNKPNRVWRGAEAKQTACYIARFVGLHVESELQPVGDALATAFRFEDERCRFRYVVFAINSNSHYRKKGVSYITFDQAISFIVHVRGQCWVDSNIGVASAHHQWDELLVNIFAIANKTEQSEEQRIDKIKSLLAA